MHCSSRLRFSDEAPRAQNADARAAIAFCREDGFVALHGGKRTPDHRAAVRHLRAADPVLERVIARAGPCKLDPEQQPDVFHALARAIVYQQLNGTAASSIFRKFQGLYPDGAFPRPSDIVQTTDKKLRSAGVSPQKARYLKDLSSRVLDGTVDLKAVRSMEDEAVIEHLTQITGVGRWTAEMVLIFALGRPDVLPVDDYGLARAVKVAYGRRQLPTPDRLRKIAEPWRPYRSVGTWYLWQSLPG